MKPANPLLLGDGNEQLSVVRLAHAGQMVLTTRQLAELYGCSGKTISHNFRYHRQDFVEGQDFFVVKGEDLKRLKSQQMAAKVAFRAANGEERNNSCLADVVLCEPGIGKFVNFLYVWTDEGALKHSEFLSTDRAKAIYSGLALSYFKPASEQEPPVQQTLFAEENLKVEKAPPKTRIEILLELVRLAEDKNLRDVLIREVASLILGKKI